MERRVKRPMLNLQHVIRGALDVPGDFVPVSGPSTRVRRISMSSVPCMSSILVADSSLFRMVDILP